MYLQFKITQTFAFVLTLQNAPAFLRLCSLHSTQNHICHATIASIGFNLNLRSSTIAITKNTIICAHTF